MKVQMLACKGKQKITWNRSVKRIVYDIIKRGLVTVTFFFSDGGSESYACDFFDNITYSVED